jgi:uncharacterized SAM-binding protein YcdF (DUF218 family)
MFYILSKILGLAVNPLLWVFALLLLGLFRLKKKKGQKVLWIAVVVFYLFGNTVILNEVLVKWEGEPVRQISKTYDYGVVLGGMIKYNPDYGTYNFIQSSDRIWQAVQAYHKGKIGKILISGGAANLWGKDTVESVLLKEFLVSIKVPDSAIVVETQSRNTHENAKYTQGMLPGASSILLFTSATHMPRAKACFEQMGVNCDTYPTNQYSSSRKYTLEDFLIPSVGTFYIWEPLIHEWVGLLMYKVVGYV